MDNVKVIKHFQGIPIVNTQQLAHGTGARYLEVIDDTEVHGTLIAKQWRRKIDGLKDTTVVDFGVS